LFRFCFGVNNDSLVTVLPEIETNESSQSSLSPLEEKWSALGTHRGRWVTCIRFEEGYGWSVSRGAGAKYIEKWRYGHTGRAAHGNGSQHLYQGYISRGPDTSRDESAKLIAACRRSLASPTTIVRFDKTNVEYFPFPRLTVLECQLMGGAVWVSCSEHLFIGFSRELELGSVRRRRMSQKASGARQVQSNDVRAHADCWQVGRG